MTHPSSRPIVVGVDGSAAATAALKWAAAEARLRHTRLRVVQVHDPSRYVGRWQQRQSLEGEHDMAWSVLTTALVDLEEFDVDVEPCVDVGHPADILIKLSRDALMVVLGRRSGTSRLAAVLVRSTALQTASRAAAPVVVVPTAGHESRTQLSAGPIVLGVDTGEAADAVIAWAFDEAATRQTTLVAVHGRPRWAGPPAPDPYDTQRAVLSEALAGWREKFPGVAVTEISEPVPPIGLLIDHSRGAAITVVGSRAPSAHRGLVLGLVAEAVLLRANSPVAVIRTEE
jgi:nucleotide-binding universal stress UspA family protein